MSRILRIFVPVREKKCWTLFAVCDSHGAYRWEWQMTEEGLKEIINERKQ